MNLIAHLPFWGQQIKYFNTSAKFFGGVVEGLGRGHACECQCFLLCGSEALNSSNRKKVFTSVMQTQPVEPKIKHTLMKAGMSKDNFRLTFKSVETASQKFKKHTLKISNPLVIKFSPTLQGLQHNPFPFTCYLTSAPSL